jgi:hypothetical protein
MRNILMHGVTLAGKPLDIERKIRLPERAQVARRWARKSNCTWAVVFSYWNRLMMMESFCPPKPKLLDSTASTRAERAWLGT